MKQQKSHLHGHKRIHLLGDLINLGYMTPFVWKKNTTWK